MNKYIYHHSPDSGAHWANCAKHRAPCIIIRAIAPPYSEIFYDITHLRHDLETVSENIRTMVAAYHQFLRIPATLTDEYRQQHYYFTFPVLSEHAEYIAAQLYDYLNHMHKPSWQP